MAHLHPAGFIAAGRRALWSWEANRRRFRGRDVSNRADDAVGRSGLRQRPWAVHAAAARGCGAAFAQGFSGRGGRRSCPRAQGKGEKQDFSPLKLAGRSGSLVKGRPGRSYRPDQTVSFSETREMPRVFKRRISFLAITL